MGDFAMALSDLPTETQFMHLLFMQQVEALSHEQRGELLEQLHLLQLSQREYIKELLLKGLPGHE